MLSLGWLKGSKHYWSIVLLGWPLPLRGNSALPVSEPSSAVSLKTPYGAAPKKVLGVVIFKIPPNSRVISNAPTRAHIQRFRSNQVSLDPFSRTRFQRFLSNPPRSSFKKFIISTLRLTQDLLTISIVKAVPKCIKDKECKWFALQERPSVPYLPEKDPIQETVSTLKRPESQDYHRGWRGASHPHLAHNGTCKAVLMHGSTALNAIEKRGTFKAYKEACEA